MLDSRLEISYALDQLAHSRDAIARALLTAGRVRSPRAELRSAPGRLRGTIVRHYDRTARSSLD